MFYLTLKQEDKCQNLGEGYLLHVIKIEEEKRDAFVDE